MPLVMMCGLPSSGKTFYANKISEYLKKKLNKNVIFLNDDLFGINKNETFMGKIF